MIPHKYKYTLLSKETGKTQRIYEYCKKEIINYDGPKRPLNNQNYQTIQNNNNNSNYKYDIQDIIIDYINNNIYKRINKNKQYHKKYNNKYKNNFNENNDEYNDDDDFDDDYNENNEDFQNFNQNNIHKNNINSKHFKINLNIKQKSNISIYTNETKKDDFIGFYGNLKSI